MSKQTWATIVYGRSYHLDFRFITIPDDFTAREIAWASPYILATTQQARNLADYPRWSLFKNDSHCVLGVTCMVRDLIGNLTADSSEVMAKDEHGRPLYVFAGYVTQLNSSQSITDFPAYTEKQLTGFQPLYQEIEKVWLVRDYDDRKPLLSEYKPLSVDTDTAYSACLLEDFHTPQLNNQARYPHKTFLWQRSIQQNNQLWLASAMCLESTSVCLDIKGKYLVNTPFLNQTITKIEQFTVKDRIIERNSDRDNLLEDDATIDTSKQASKNLNSSTLKQKISTRAQEDLSLTLQQAARVTSASKEIINNFTHKSDSNKDSTERSSSSSEERENFGFKTKKAPPSSQDRDWF